MPGTAQYPERFLYSHVYVPGFRWVALDGHEKFNGHDVFFTTVDGISSFSWFGQSNPNGQEMLVWDKDAA
jgi:transglutaminase-like putative cysteine protease